MAQITFGANEKHTLFAAPDQKLEVSWIDNTLVVGSYPKDVFPALPQSKGITWGHARRFTSMAVLDAQIEALKRLRVDHVRLNFSRRDHIADVIVDKVTQAGISIIANYYKAENQQTYTAGLSVEQRNQDDLAALIEAYPQIGIWVIQNEVNRYENWNDPRNSRGVDRYLQLYTRSKNTIHSINPNVLVAYAGISEYRFFETSNAQETAYADLLENAGAGQIVQLWSWHPYASNPDSAARKTQKFLAWTKSIGSEAETLVGEYGYQRFWSRNGGYVDSSAKKTQYIVEGYRKLSELVPVVTLYSFSESGSFEGYSLTIIENVSPFVHFMDAFAPFAEL